MAKKNPYQGPIEALAHYEKVVATLPAVKRKGAKNPYTSLNGHMFSFLDADGAMAIRLSREEQAEFMAKYRSGPVEQYGRTMRDYVAVPDELLAATEELAPWFERSYEYIATLKPKPTKRA